MPRQQEQRGEPRRRAEEGPGLGRSKASVQGKNVEQIVEEKVRTARSSRQEHQLILVQASTPPVASRALVKRTARTQRRPHRLLNSTLLFILLASLFSLYACPPPDAAASPPSLYTRLNPFVATPHLVPAWERLVCQPTNAYRTHVLEPYVVPHVRRRIARARANPLLQGYVEPALARGTVLARRVWRDRLANPVGRLAHVGEAVYARYLAPRLPVLRAHAYRLIQRIRGKVYNIKTHTVRAITRHPTYVDFARRAEPHYRALHAHGRRTLDALLPRLHHAHARARPVLNRWSARAVVRGKQGGAVIKGWVVPGVARALERGLDEAERVWERVIA